MVQIMAKARQADGAFLETHHGWRTLLNIGEINSKNPRFVKGSDGFVRVMAALSDLATSIHTSFLYDKYKYF